MSGYFPKPKTLGANVKDVIIFGGDMTSSVNIDDKNKDILILDEGPTDELDDTAIIAEAKYSVNISNHRSKIHLSLHYNVINSFLYADGVKIYQSKAKDSEIKKISNMYEKYI